MTKASVSQIREQFDLVVANIDPKTIEEMRVPLMERVAAGGTLILSGVLDGEVDLLKQLFPDGSFTLMEISQEEGWACVVLKRT